MRPKIKVASYPTVDLPTISIHASITANPTVSFPLDPWEPVLDLLKELISDCEYSILKSQATYGSVIVNSV